MTVLPDLVLRASRLLCAPLLLLALAACGPGTGGTGTGPNHSLSYSGMVGSSFGAGLAIGVPCTDNCPTVSLRVETERVELTAPCHRFAHLGTWSIDGNGLAVLPGTLETTTIVNNQPKVDTTQALMRLQFSDANADSRQVMLTVRDANGRNLLSPLTLQRGDGAGGASACTGAP